jgi:hypothetical protein
MLTFEMSSSPSPAYIAANERAGKLFWVVKSMRKFDTLELGGVLSSVVHLPRLDCVDYREQCFLATYYRTAGMIESFLRLDGPEHFQAAAMLARSLFELAADIKLAEKVPQGFLKVVFFVDVEKLHRARQMIAFAQANPDRGIDVSSQTEFVKNNGASIDSNRQVLWPPQKTGGKLSPLRHWSGAHLSTRVELLGEPFDAMYKFQYPRLSWYVHDGLTGVVNLPAETFLNVYGYATSLVITCYTLILESVIREFKIDRAVEKIHKALKLATLLPFSKDPEQEDALIRALLG